MKKLCLFLSVFLFLSCAPSLMFAQQSQNYCHDKESNEQWNKMVEKYPQDYALQAVHAIRIGLCEKIDRGEISLEEGVIWFNDIFNMLKQERFKQEVNEAVRKNKEEM